MKKEPVVFHPILIAIAPALALYCLNALKLKVTDALFFSFGLFPVMITLANKFLHIDLAPCLTSITWRIPMSQSALES